MSGFEILLLLLPLISVFFIFGTYGNCGYTRGRKKILNLPPGNLAGLPFIGEAFSFFRPHHSPSLSKFLIQRKQRYGRIFKMNLFGEPTIVSLDRDFNKFVLQNEMNTFAASYYKNMKEMLGKWSLGVQTGVLHQTIRYHVKNFVNGNNLWTSLTPMIDREASFLLDSWKNYPSVSVVEQCKKFAFTVMVRYVLNMDIGDDELMELKGEYDNFLRGFVAFPINFPGTTFNRGMQARSTILKMIENKAEEMRKSTIKDNDIKKSLFYIVVNEMNLTMEQIPDIIIGLIFGGYSTLADSLSLAIYFLKPYSKAVHQLQEEHSALVKEKKDKGEERLTWNDYKQMEFTHCVINETLRLGNVGKMLFREATEDVHYKGFDIPCGWKVITVIASAHLDPSNYEDPLAFNPWRWKVTNNKNMMPFGGGPRLCPGSEMAKLEMAIFIHHLIQRYDWELLASGDPIFFPFKTFPQGFPIRVFPIKDKDEYDVLI